MPAIRQKEHKGMPFPEAPTGPLDEHEDRIVKALQREFTTKGKIKRPPNAFILFRSWAIQCHKDARVLDFVPQETNDELHSRGAGYAATAWKFVTPAGRAHWTRRAKVVANAHYALFPKYQYRPVHKPKAEKEARREKLRADRVRKGLPADPPPKRATTASESPAPLDCKLDDAPLPDLPFGFFDSAPAPGPSYLGRRESHPAGLLFSHDDAPAPAVPSWRIYRHRRASSVLADNTVFERRPRPLSSLDRDAVPNIARSFRPYPQQQFEQQPLDAFAQAVMSASEIADLPPAPHFINPFAAPSFGAAAPTEEGDAYSQSSTFAPSPSALPAAQEDKFPLQTHAFAPGGLELLDVQYPMAFELGYEQELAAPQGYEQPQYAPGERTLLQTLDSVTFDEMDAYLSASSEESSPNQLNSLGLDFELLVQSQPQEQEQYDFSAQY